MIVQNSLFHINLNFTWEHDRLSLNLCVHYMFISRTVISNLPTVSVSAGCARALSIHIYIRITCQHDSLGLKSCVAYIYIILTLNLTFPTLYESANCAEVSNSHTCADHMIPRRSKPQFHPLLHYIDITQGSK